MYMQKKADVLITSHQASTMATDDLPRSMTMLQSSQYERLKTFWTTWYPILKTIFPLYIAVRLAFLVTTSLSVLFTLKDFQWAHMPLHTLWLAWNQGDTAYSTGIAMYGYHQKQDTAFFPLYPLLERGLTFFVHSPLFAGFIISNLAGLVMLAVLYRMIAQDFHQDHAYRAVLYLSIFPTAFFFAAAYNEALFLCLTLLSFYSLRHGRWWLAGIFGLLASLTRSAGLLLLLPFGYEYLRQHQFRLKSLRFDVISVALIPTGTTIFSLYCYYRFGDFLAFSHVQAYWDHHLNPPWDGIIRSLQSITTSNGLLNFQSLHNFTDLLPDLFILLLLLLGFVGPWRFPRAYWSYLIYGISLYLFFQLFPTSGLFPLQSTSRYILEIFPAFIVLATIGKYRMLNLNYIMISSAMLFFLLTQFLTGHWII